MVQPAPICFFNPGILTPEQAQYSFAMYIDGYPREEFKYIEFENIVLNKYFITSYGRVFTTDGRELIPIDDYAHNNKEYRVYFRIQLECIDDNGNLIRRKFYIHRLVANAFISKSLQDIEANRNIVNHKYNMDGRCNYYWNLEWCTEEENKNHYLYFCETYDPSFYDITYITNRNEYLRKTRITTNRATKISDFQAMLICEAYMNRGYSPEDCAIYACLEPTPDIINIIRSIISGRTWCAISSRFGIIPSSKK